MKWAVPTLNGVVYIGNNLRQVDRMEVLLSDNMPGREAVLRSWIESDISQMIVTDEEEPCGMVGINHDIIWMLGTDKLIGSKKDCFQLCREARRWVEQQLKELNRPLWNDVWVKNTTSIAWLKSIGFTVEQPRPMGDSAALFCRFWRKP